MAMNPTAGRRPTTVEDVLVAIEAARDKVMADEIKSLTKLGIPKSMAYQMVATRFRQKVPGQAEEEDIYDASNSGTWDEIR